LLLQHAFFLFQLDDSFFCRHALTLRPLAPFGKLLGNLSSYLNFLIERGSTTGYWLRDDIL